MPLKLLAVGDMHLGRVPSRLPANLDSAHLGPAVAWERGVDAAIDASVDVVILAGDVVEKENDFFEGYRHLHRGVTRLSEAGITVLGVVGNHDASVLPRLAREIDDFDLLGENACWQSRKIEADGESVTLWGWSMPSREFPSSPLSGVTFERRPGLNLGVMHCDLDQSKSRYAPLSRRELEASGLDGWFLGHIHRPDDLKLPYPIGYLGSIMGLDPGEPGLHGPWLVTIDGGQVRDVEQWGLAPIRWERLEVDLSDIAEAEEARVRLLAAVKDLDRSLSGKRWIPQAIGLRVSFTGPTRHGRGVERLFSDEADLVLLSGSQGTEYFLERAQVLTRPEIELDKLAERADPPGLLAQRLLVLDQPVESPERRRLIAEARETMEERSRQARWQKLGIESPDDETVALQIRRAGLCLLEGLLAQQESQS